MIAQTRRIFVIFIASIWFLTIFSGLFLSVNAQPDSNRLPILLIHGYAQGSSVWNTWIGWLRDDQFSHVYPITFQFNDRCGSVAQHAMQLNNYVDGILSRTGYEEVNIVAHSKGGLDARWYVANSDTDKVANLIMIGTPNAGSEAANLDLTGCPLGAARDLLPGSLATQVEDRPENTNYYTIAGNWMPSGACLWSSDPGNCAIPGEDDGFVAVDSVESNPAYIPLGPPLPYDHLELLEQRDAYEMALQILDG